MAAKKPQAAGIKGILGMDSLGSPEADDYEDIRAELRANGHNLTSVLVNPRETIFDHLFDEFETDQAMPLETVQTVVLPEVDLKSVQGLMARLRRVDQAWLSSQHARKEPRQKVITEQDVHRCFQQVPEMFFQPDFSLRDPETFESTLGSRAPDSYNERLSQYLDLVEVALSKQITAKSPSFFRALTDIQQLQKSAAEAVSRVNELRAMLRAADSEICIAAMRVPQLRRRQINLNALHEKLQVIQQILLARDTIQERIAAEDFLTALDVIRGTRQVFDKELEAIAALQPVKKQLEEFSNVICEVMAANFVSVAIGADVTPESPATSSEDLADICVALGEGFLPSVVGLLAINTLNHALNLYKARLNEHIKLIIRTVVTNYLTSFDPTMGVPDPDEDIVTDTETPFAQRVRAMDPDSFVTCISLCCEEVEGVLSRSRMVVRFLTAVLSVATTNGHAEPVAVAAAAAAATNGKENGNGHAKTSSDQSGIEAVRDVTAEMLADYSEADRQRLLSLCSECLATSCELSMRSLSQLIATRREVNARLSTLNMQKLWKVVTGFLTYAESLTNTQGYALRNTLVVQTRLFLEQKHESNTQMLINTLDCERWNQVDCSPERQQAITKLTTGRAFLPSSDHTPANGVLRASDVHVEEHKANGVDTDGGGKEDGSTPTPRRKPEPTDVLVDGVHFKVVWSALLLCELIMGYLEIGFTFTPVTNDVVNRVADIIRLFNSRTYHLVHQAGARQSTARLKSISAKHIALAAQSVGLVLAILPHVRAALMAHIPAKQHVLLAEFDRVSQELREHHGKLLLKVVQIVGEFIESKTASLRALDWDRFQGQSEYFQEAQKTVTTLHKVVVQILPPEQVQDVFSRIYLLLNRNIPIHFEQVQPATKTGRQRILDEVSHLVTTLSRLVHTDASSLTLEETFRRKYGV